MPTPTYDLLLSSVLTSSVASVTFSSISQDYRDLVLVVNCSATSVAALQMRFNSDTGNNYSWVSMYGNGTSTFSETQANVSYGTISANAAIPTSGSTVYNAQILDYTATDKHKSWVARGNNISRGTDAVAGRWASTSAITNLLVRPETGSFNSGSTFHLYGIK